VEVDDIGGAQGPRASHDGLWADVVAGPQREVNNLGADGSHRIHEGSFGATESHEYTTPLLYLLGGEVKHHTLDSAHIPAPENMPY
jgi:hypothetical protein